MTSSETAILTQKHQLLPFWLILMVSIKKVTPMVLQVKNDPAETCGSIPPKLSIFIFFMFDRERDTCPRLTFAIRSKIEFGS